MKTKKRFTDEVKKDVRMEGVLEEGPDTGDPLWRSLKKKQKKKEESIPQTTLLPRCTDQIRSLSRKIDCALETTITSLPHSSLA